MTACLPADCDLCKCLRDHEWLGLGLLRHAWLNVDLLWTFALVGIGVLLLFV